MYIPVFIMPAIGKISPISVFSETKLSIRKFFEIILSSIEFKIGVQIKNNIKNNVYLIKVSLQLNGNG